MLILCVLGVDAEVIKEATFCIQYEGGLGVFYTPNLAVISNMSVPEELEAGSSVKVISPGTHCSILLAFSRFEFSILSISL